jgi:hypothetical protein
LRAAGIALAAGLPALAQAAQITWDLPSDVSGDSDVLNGPGTVVQAYSFASSTDQAPITVDGVDFTRVLLPILTNPNDFGADSLSGVYPDSVDSNFGAPGSLSSAYQSLLESGAFLTTSGSVMTLSLGGLIVGDSYQFEMWASNTNATYNVGGETVASGNSVQLLYNTGSLDAGQFVTGTFVADSTSQVLTLTGDPGQSTINAFVLAATTPEPATLWYMGMALGGLGLWARRRRT